MNSILLHILHQAIFGGVAATGFAVLFNCRPGMLPLCFGAGALALTVRTIGQDFGFSLAAASFFAAFLLATVDRLWQEFPSPRGSVLAVAGSIPMIPGSLAAKVFMSVFAFLKTGKSLGTEATIATWNNVMMLIFTLGAIGTALALPTLFPAGKAKKSLTATDG